MMFRNTVMRRMQSSIAKGLFKGKLDSSVYPYPDANDAVKEIRSMEDLGGKDLGSALGVVTSKMCEWAGCGGEHTAYCLTEAGSGTDPSGVATTAELTEDGEHYIINGTKSWVTNGANADTFAVYATVSVDGRKRLSCFKVTRQDEGSITNGPSYNTMGLESCQVYDVTFKNVKVPKTSLLSEGGYKAALNLRTRSQPLLSAAVLGGHKRLLKYITKHASERKAFGRRLRDLSLIKQRVALVTMRIYAGESMLYLMPHGEEEGLDNAIESSLVKIFTTKTAVESLDDAAQVLGAKFYLTSDEGNMLYRDINGYRAVGGTEEINRLYSALTGLEVSGKHLTSKSTLQVMLGRTKKSMGMIENSSGHHPSLKQAAVVLDKQIAKASTAFEAVLIKFGKKITDEQIVVSKVAEVITLLYSMAAVLSRASKSVSTSADSSQHEIVLATTWVRHCAPTLDRLCDDIQNIFKTLDSNLGRIADHVSDVNGYIPLHPADY